MVDDVDMDTFELGPLERRRISLASHCRTENEYWFNDGDIVLGVESKHFKIHRSKLMCSFIFAGMFKLPQPEDAETVDGCPVVHLPQDKESDWRATLNWMYDPKTFKSQPTVFSVVAGALRISTKYVIARLRTWCKRQLLSRWPEDLMEMDSTAMPNAAEAICLARELDVPQILPAAFYALYVQQWSSGGDGGHSDDILSADDLRRLIIGREELQKRLLNLVTYLDSRLEGDTLCRGCRRVCAALLGTYLRPSSPYGSWLLRDLQQLSTDCFETCCPCRFCVGDTVDDLLMELRDAIPKYFRL